MTPPAEDAVHAFYSRGMEHGRLAEPLGEVEYLRTLQLLAEHLPPPPARIADIGGGPGRYALTLAAQGYAVHHRDLVGIHVEQLREEDHQGRVDTAVADARELDLPDQSMDGVLLLGPLYHLEDRSDRLRALAEARRIAKPGAVVVAAAISRWAPRLHGVLAKRLYRELEDLPSIVRDVVEVDGRMQPLFEGSFTAYTHRPQELLDEVQAAGLHVLDMVGLEGAAFALLDLDERMADDRDRAVVLETARALQRVPELLGLSPHLLVVCRAP